MRIRNPASCCQEPYGTERIASRQESAWLVCAPTAATPHKKKPLPCGRGCVVPTTLKISVHARAVVHGLVLHPRLLDRAAATVEHDDFAADVDARIEVGDVFVEHADAA